LRNRKKPIAIGARAILRAGSGHKYWSAFSLEAQVAIETAAKNLKEVLFDPEVSQPIKTLDLPLGGSVSPIEALSLLIEFLSIADSTQTLTKSITSYEDDPDGSNTATVLRNALGVARRITGNSNGSLGLHPAVYFYNERGKHSRFLFLGMALLISRKMKDNDSEFFQKFTKSREKMEAFLIENKSLIGILLQNMNKQARVGKIRDLYMFLINGYLSGKNIKVEEAIEYLGARGRILDITTAVQNTSFSDDTKSALFVNKALTSAIKCGICNGLLDPTKSVSYDHVTPVRDGGTGDISNGDLVHPYCNQSVKC
jgi:hypothetical protein